MADDPQVPGVLFSSPRAYALSEDEQMLLLVRDELYEGNWDDFVQDLQDRLSGRPHLFDIQPASARLQDTIRQHLRMIERLRELERRERIDLAAYVKAASGSPPTHPG